jgi:SWI/SNF-related matrix-associated actin-dependent regulator 1 of chromatin subfamily A
MRINASRRVLLTGTPLQNNLTELLSLLNFIMPKIFRGATEHLLGFFKQLSLESGDNSVRDAMIAKARRIMDPFMLRRKKDVVLKDLPQKKHVVHRCPLTSTQQYAYDALILSLKKTLVSDDLTVTGRKKAQQPTVTTAADEGVAATATVGRGHRSSSTTHVPPKSKPNPKALAAAAPPSKSGHVQNTGGLANLLMQARKMANHPLLHRVLYTDAKIKKMARSIMSEDEYAACPLILVLPVFCV